MNISKTTHCRSCNKECINNRLLSLTINNNYRHNYEDYQFCGIDCKESFKLTKCCWFCNCVEDLVYVPEIERFVCTTKLGSTTWKYSCMDEYNLRKMNHLDLLVNHYYQSDYDEMTKSYHERIMNLTELLSEALKRIDDLEEEVRNLKNH